MPDPSFLLASTCTHTHTVTQLTIVKPPNLTWCVQEEIRLLTVSYLDMRERTVDPDGTKKLHPVYCRQLLLCAAFDFVCFIAYSTVTLFRGSVTTSMLRRPLLCGNTRSPMHNISSITLCWFIVKLAWNSHKYCQWGKE